MQGTDGNDLHRTMTSHPELLCPLVTPFTDEAVDTDALGQLVESLAATGIDGFVPCGTSGEVASLTPEERRRVIETTVENSSHGQMVIAGAAATAVRSAVERIESAAAAGADAALLPSPYYHPPNSTAGLKQFFAAVADDAALPIYLYDIPSCTGQQIPTEVTEALSSHPNVVGLKDSTGDYKHFSAALRVTPDDFDVYQGFDTQFVQSVQIGATGGICGLTNATPESFLDMATAIGEGNYERAARLQQTAITPIFELGLEEGFAPVLKTAAVTSGRLPSQHVRPPLIETSAEGAALIEDVLST